MRCPSDMASPEALRDAVSSFCTGCQQWDFQVRGHYRKCNCGKPDNSHELSARYVSVYRTALKSFSVNEGIYFTR